MLHRPVKDRIRMTTQPTCKQYTTDRSELQLWEWERLARRARDEALLLLTGRRWRRIRRMKRMFIRSIP
jgi:hypothetical protein